MESEMEIEVREKIQNIKIVDNKSEIKCIDLIKKHMDMGEIIKDMVFMSRILAMTELNIDYRNKELVLSSDDEIRLQSFTRIELEHTYDELVESYKKINLK